MKNLAEKLWTKSFLILWQGQLISTLGDAVYSIALGFWVLQVTGSTALMGTLMAASTLPGVLISPFAGVLIDRCNKKRLFIIMDIIRGICIVLLATAAYQGWIAIWMAFVAGIVLSLCGAVFTPGIMATVPDLVPKSKIENANSVFSVLNAGSNMIGNAAGGFLLQALGAPILFLFDGLSFLFSSISLPFVKIPKNTQKEKPHFFEDMAEGFRFIWRQKGLRIILTVAALSNFFSFIAIVLLLPFCQSTPSLGAGKYGILMASYMIGAMAGFMALSVFTIKPEHKLIVSIISSTACYFGTIAAILQSNFILMVVLLVLAGSANSVFNVILISTIQSSTPQSVRGKVMSFLNMITQGLTPFAMALGGVLGGIFPIRYVIAAAFLGAFFTGLPAFVSKSFRDYISTDYSKEETAMERLTTEKSELTAEIAAQD